MIPTPISLLGAEAFATAWALGFFLAGGDSLAVLGRFFAGRQCHPGQGHAGSLSEEPAT